MTRVVEIHLQPDAVFPGAERAGHYRVPEYLRQFTKTHAIITFSEPVIGPVVIGAGRYVGLGLMAGLSDREERYSWQRLHKPKRKPSKKRNAPRHPGATANLKLTFHPDHSAGLFIFAVGVILIRAARCSSTNRRAYRHHRASEPAHKGCPPAGERPCPYAIGVWLMRGRGLAG